MFSPWKQRELKMEACLRTFSSFSARVGLFVISFLNKNSGLANTFMQ